MKTIPLKFIKEDPAVGNADSSEDARESTGMLERLVADLRARDPQREHLLLYANQVLATVARRHSGVDGQQTFNKWIEDMELNDPALFLPRLRNVVDVLVQDDWWLDREALQAALPVT